MKLDVHSNIKIEKKIVSKKKQEFKFLGSCKKKKGQKLYACNTDNFEVYEVEIIKRTTFDVMAKKEKSTHKTTVNPNHPHLFALNKKNAVRKFKKLLINIKN